LIVCPKKEDKSHQAKVQVISLNQNKKQNLSKRIRE